MKIIYSMLVFLGLTLAFMKTTYAAEPDTTYYDLRSGQQVTLNTYNGPVTVTCNRGGPGGGGSAAYYLSLPDYQLFQHALGGIGFCVISGGCPTCACNYYVKVGGIGYPSGTGCQDSQSNAVYYIRQALQFGRCGI